MNIANDKKLAVTIDNERPDMVPASFNRRAENNGFQCSSRFTHQVELSPRLKLGGFAGLEVTFAEDFPQFVGVTDELLQTDIYGDKVAPSTQTSKSVAKLASYYHVLHVQYLPSYSTLFRTI